MNRTAIIVRGGGKIAARVIPKKTLDRLNAMLEKDPKLLDKLYKRFEGQPDPLDKVLNFLTLRADKIN